MELVTKNNSLKYTYQVVTGIKAKQIHWILIWNHCQPGQWLDSNFVSDIVSRLLINTGGKRLQRNDRSASHSVEWQIYATISCHIMYQFDNISKNARRKPLNQIHHALKMICVRQG